MATPELHHEIKQLILEAVRIEGVTPEQVDDEAPLFGNPVLGLDSVDALEIVVALQRKYDVHIDDNNLARTVLQSVKTVADFVVAKRAART